MTSGPKCYLVDQIKEDRMREGMWHARERTEMYVRLLLENLKEREHFGRPKHR
jgi:hypothetical protein